MKMHTGAGTPSNMKPLAHYTIRFAILICLLFSNQEASAASLSCWPSGWPWPWPSSGGGNQLDDIRRNRCIEPKTQKRVPFDVNAYVKKLKATEHLWKDADDFEENEDW